MNRLFSLAIGERLPLRTSIARALAKHNIKHNITFAIGPPIPERPLGVGGGHPPPTPRMKMKHMGFPSARHERDRVLRVIQYCSRRHEEFKRRIKTQTVLPCVETAAMLFSRCWRPARSPCETSVAGEASPKSSSSRSLTSPHAGAIPKDGPRAGVAMFLALVSLMTERSVREDTAMTGEISLRGLVLPVGASKRRSSPLMGPESNTSCCRREIGRTSRISQKRFARGSNSAGLNESMKHYLSRCSGCVDPHPLRAHRRDRRPSQSFKGCGRPDGAGASLRRGRTAA